MHIISRSEVQVQISPLPKSGYLLVTFSQEGREKRKFECHAGPAYSDKKFYPPKNKN